MVVGLVAVVVAVVPGLMGHRMAGPVARVVMAC